MSGEPQYTQIKRPVSRVAEKVLGWLNWIGLLLLTVATMFIALVSFSNDTSIQKLEQTLTTNDFAQQILTNNGLNTTQFVIWLQNGIWAVIVYLIVCLLISFLALISMNLRVLSGILFLVASIITLPLVLLLATVIIPVLFFIVAIMMFARKDRVETVPFYPGGYGADDRGYGYDDYEDSRRYPRHEPAYEKRDRAFEEEDDTRVYRPERDNRSKEDAFAAGAGAATAPHERESDNLAHDTHPNEYSEDETNTMEEDDSQFLSRQAKYKQKSEEEVREQQETDAKEREQARINDIEGRNEEEDEDIQNRFQEPRRGETAEEKAARKREKKERKKRAKELRKQRPSAVNQRRMNFEERRSFNQHKTEDSNVASEDTNSDENTVEAKDETKDEK